MRLQHSGALGNFIRLLQRKWLQNASTAQNFVVHVTKFTRTHPHKFSLERHVLEYEFQPCVLNSETNKLITCGLKIETNIPINLAVH